MLARRTSRLESDKSLYLVGTLLDVAKLITVDAGKIVYTFTGHKGTVYGAHFHPRK